MNTKSSATLHPHSPDNPERIASFQARYAALLEERQPDSSPQLRAAFLKEMEGKEYGEGPLLNAFAWFWSGWAASSGSRSTRSETASRDAIIGECALLADAEADKWWTLPNGREAAMNIASAIRARKNAAPSTPASSGDAVKAFAAITEPRALIVLATITEDQADVLGMPVSYYEKAVNFGARLITRRIFAAAGVVSAVTERGPSRDDVIEECASYLEKAPLTYAGPDPTGVKQLRFLMCLALRGLKESANE